MLRSATCVGARIRPIWVPYLFWSQSIGKILDQLQTFWATIESWRPALTSQNERIYQCCWEGSVFFAGQNQD